MGEESRAIKALSAEEIEGYLTGTGMALAKAAELNHYPGPRHVLDLAGELGLSADQRQRTERVFAGMRAEAVRLGEEIVARERELDARFAAGDITPAELDHRVVELGALQGRLRVAHLRAHLAQRAILTDEQRARYDSLRGYGDRTSPARTPAHHGH